MTIKNYALIAGVAATGAMAAAVGLAAFDSARAQADAYPAAPPYQFMSAGPNTVWVLNSVTGSVAICRWDTNYGADPVCSRTRPPRN